MNVETAFIEYSRIFLAKELLPRVHGAIDRISDDDLWWRPNDASNSAGNLVLHLAGNMRQWIVSGIGGTPDVRRREEEFAPSSVMPRATLLERLDEAAADADAVLADLATDELLSVRSIQGRRVSVLEAIYHVVEHFSMHTGQIIYIVKLRAEQDLGFYRLEDGIPRAQWNDLSGE